MTTLGQRSEELQGTFTGRISRRLSLLLGLIFLVVILIGGVFLLSARSIYLSTEEIERQGRHVETIEEVHASVHHLIAAVQHSIITGTPLPEDEQQKLMAHLKGHAEEYAELEEVEGDFPDKEKEMRIFLEIKKMIAELLPVTEKVVKAATRGQGIDRSDLEYLNTLNTRIPDLTYQMNEIHRTNTKRSVQASWKRMWVIFTSYLAFIVIGSLLILGSNLVFYRTIVLPIRRLASATLDVARGDFQKRVSVTSRDEIGQLSHAFNAMAERLEEHEKMLQTLATLEERERIAREMHDGLAQALGYLHMHLAALEARTSPEAQDGIRAELREIKKVAGDAYEEIRQSIFGLRTMVSRGLGLIPTLTEYVHDFSRQTGIAVDLQIGGDHAPRFSPDVEVQLLRIIQEALANIRKHAAATHAEVRFDVEGDRSCVTVRDDGRGFEPGKILEERSRHFGLQAMRERAEGVGGNLEIEAAPGRGTKVMVQLPLECPSN
ncbi:MAG: HAMP domain-containing protein [Candidatus Methylomirabilales bacterium]